MAELQQTKLKESKISIKKEVNDEEPKPYQDHGEAWLSVIGKLGGQFVFFSPISSISWIDEHLFIAKAQYKDVILSKLHNCLIVHGACDILILSRFV